MPAELATPPTHTYYTELHCPTHLIISSPCLATPALHAPKTDRRPWPAPSAPTVLIGADERGGEENICSSGRAILTRPDTRGGNIRLTDPDPGSRSQICTEGNPVVGGRGVDLASAPRPLNQVVHQFLGDVAIAGHVGVMTHLGVCVRGEGGA